MLPLPLLQVTKRVVQGIPMSHIALALAVLAFLFVLPALFEPKKFRAAMEEFANASNSLFRVAALFHLLVAFFILNTHWTVNLDSDRSIMTVIGYLILIRGAVWLWFPEFVKKWMKKFFQKETNVYVMAVLGLLFALGFGYLGLRVY